MSQKFTREQVAERTDKKNTLFIIDNVVYDVTPFLDEHPGGHEVLVNVSGKDASEDFDDIGHSLDAKELMKKYAVGELVDEDKKEVKKKYVSWEQSGGGGEQSAAAGGLLGSWKLPVLLALVATVLYSYVFA